MDPGTLTKSQRHALRRALGRLRHERFAILEQYALQDARGRPRRKTLPEVARANIEWVEDAIARLEREFPLPKRPRAPRDTKEFP